MRRIGRHNSRARLVMLVVAALIIGSSAHSALAAQPQAHRSAEGGPGALSYFDLARKDCVGTATGRTSKVWFTVAGGVLSDVYEPTVDNSNVATLQYVVTDGSTFTDLQTRDLSYTVTSGPGGMDCTVTATSAAHHYRLITTYLTDPARDAVLMHTRLETETGDRQLRLYARLDAHVNGNGGGGNDNGGADTGTVHTVQGAAVPVVQDTSTASEAVNRDYAVPTFTALRSTSGSPTASVGYAGTSSDGLDQLDAEHKLGAPSMSAPNGHVVAVEDVTPAHGRNDVDLALGFGRNADQAVSVAGDSLSQPFASTQAQYREGWRAYDAALRQPPARWSDAYYLSANVLKASEDKTFPGAIAASLASPWGQAVSAGALVDGKPVYFGSYREVFARDLYETFTGLLVDGDIGTARDTVRFLFERQQLADGRMPRNSLPNGKIAPDTGGDQLDETSYPILMAYQAGLGGDDALWRDHIQRAADFLVAHGPSFGVERWEEQTGHSPSTIAAEIAGLTAASLIAVQHGDHDRGELYQATADEFQRNIKSWTVTTTGPYAPRYFIRLSKTGDPNAAISYNQGNGGPTLDQRHVLDGGFQELIRLGELPANDPDVQASLAVLDKQISVTTPSGVGYYRYGTSAVAGSADGYGDCYQPSQTSCTTQGQPWPTTNTGTGHLWPVLSGERAESNLAGGDVAAATELLTAMTKFSSGVGLVPEQAWENPDLPAAPYGSASTTASIGFVTGKAAGSAAPLTWAQAQEVRLIADLSAARLLEQPDLTTNRYVNHSLPVAVPVTLTSPTSDSSARSTDTEIAGRTTPGAHVVIGLIAPGTGASIHTLATTAQADGSFRITVPIGSGMTVLNVAVSTKNGTGYAHPAIADSGNPAVRH